MKQFSLTDFCLIFLFHWCNLYIKRTVYLIFFLFLYYPEVKEATQEEDLKTFYKELKKYDYKKTISIDETGFRALRNLSYGRSKSGDRVLIKKNKYPFKKYNFLCAIMYGKIVGYTLYPETNTGVKSTDIVEFHNTYIKDKYKDYLIIMDNVAMHKAKIIKEAIESNRNTLMHSSPYHPDTNSAIENFFSQLKAYVKKESPATYDDLKKCIDKVIRFILKSCLNRNIFTLTNNTRVFVTSIIYCENNIICSFSYLTLKSNSHFFLKIVPINV